MIRGLPVLDAHIHLDPYGSPVEAVNHFRKAGGTHLLIIHKPYHHLKELSVEDHRRSFDTTVEMCELANRNGVKAWCVVGPYPGNLPHLAKEVGDQKAEEIHLQSLEIAFEMFDEGLTVGVGEIGRIHYQADEKYQRSCDRILETAMSEASGRGCPVILHTESPRDNPNLFKHIAKMADATNLQRKKVVKHYSGWEAADPDVGMGLSVSMQARRNNIENALYRGLDFLLETDYIDDKKRPNVVMPPDTVPKKIGWAYRKDILTEDFHHRLMIEVPMEVLGINTQKD